MKDKNSPKRLPSKTLIDKPIRYSSDFTAWFKEWSDECGESPEVLKSLLEKRFRDVMWAASTLWEAEGPPGTYEVALHPGYEDRIDLFFKFRKNGIFICGYRVWMRPDLRMLKPEVINSPAPE